MYMRALLICLVMLPSVGIAKCTMNPLVTTVTGLDVNGSFTWNGSGYDKGSFNPPSVALPEPVTMYCTVYHEGYVTSGTLNSQKYNLGWGTELTLYLPSIGNTGGRVDHELSFGPSSFYPLTEGIVYVVTNAEMRTSGGTTQPQDMETSVPFVSTVTIPDAPGSLITLSGTIKRKIEPCKSGSLNLNLGTIYGDQIPSIGDDVSAYSQVQSPVSCDPAYAKTVSVTFSAPYSELSNQVVRGPEKRGIGVKLVAVATGKPIKFGTRYSAEEINTLQPYWVRYGETTDPGDFKATVSMTTQLN